VINEPHGTLSPESARALLGRAWEAVVGGPAPAEGVALLTAQWALETNAGRSMPGHNFGGIKAAPGAAGASFRTVEGYGTGQREVSARFRVYDSAETGARDYVRLLATRYPIAIEAARRGDSEGFAHALASGGYFTADPSVYARGLEERLRELENNAPKGAVGAPAAARNAALWGVLQALSRERDDS
jgi:hypothetical protein